jgi:molybdopterin/thiamine biosynthesis adenylyltransferase
MMKLGQVAQQSIEEVLELIRKGNIPSIEHVLWNGMPAREVRIKDNAFYLSEKEYSMLIDEMVSQSLVEDEIPKNSETLLISEETSRFNSAIWFDKTRKQDVTIAGLGGIGSYVVFMLSRLDVNTMTLYDPDIVERVNLSGQLYNSDQIGDYKVDAAANMIANYSNYYSFVAKHEKLDENSMISKVTICGFDNMKARKDAFRNWTNFVARLPEEERGECLFIDGRLAAEELQVFCIKGDDTDGERRYEPYLFSDSQAAPTVCSYKQTTFMANMIGSIIVNLFINFVANQCNPLIDRDLPFYTEYNAETMYFKTIA